MIKVVAGNSLYQALSLNYDMYFDINISPLIIILLSIAAAAAIYVIAVCLLRILPVVRHKRHCDENAESVPDKGYQGVSVIIYSQDEAARLEQLLPVILRQEYPAPFEVIVVNDGESTDVRDTVGALQNAYHNLYLTATPDGARNLSRKKLGVTLGIKAARYDVAVLLTATSDVRSERWLRAMMQPFNTYDSVDIVLGYAASDEKDALGNTTSRTASFDHVADSLRWLGAALTGHPYRGTELNIAYRRNAFFVNKGFSRSLNLHYGDDDIFISEIARADNTAVQLGEDSIVGISCADIKRNLRETAIRHRFTSRFIKKKPNILIPATGMIMTICLACAVAAIIFEYSNIFVVACASVAILAMCITLGIVLHKAMIALHGRRLMLTLPFLAATRPLRKAALAIKARFSHQKKYTWD